MKNFDTRTYSIADLEEWHESDLLDLSPEFQRRSVWKQSAKSYLIDTVIRGRPIPKVIFTQQLRDRRNVRTVVDGQQRLRAILEFLEDAFPISKAHNKDHAGMYFSDLPETTEREFRKYEIGVDLLFDVAYEDMLDIFTRLNAYTVPLKREEKLNARYVGFFKQATFSAGHRYAEYWQKAKVLTPSAISRMGEAALAGDLLIMLLKGPQSNKIVEDYYRRYEDKEGPVPEAEDKFEKVMRLITAIYPDKELTGTIWTRVVQFYTMFGAIAALKGHLPQKYPQDTTLANQPTRLRVRLDNFSTRYMEAASTEELSPEQFSPEYLELSRRRTADKSSREDRIEYVARELIKG